MKFYAKPDTWFDEYTEVLILIECGTVSDRHGTLTLNALCRGYKNGNIDEEMCPCDEFGIVGNDYFPEDNELRKNR